MVSALPATLELFATTDPSGAISARSRFPAVRLLDHNSWAFKVPLPVTVTGNSCRSPTEVPAMVPEALHSTEETSQSTAAVNGPERDAATADAVAQPGPAEPDPLIGAQPSDAAHEAEARRSSGPPTATGTVPAGPPAATHTDPPAVSVADADRSNAPEMVPEEGTRTR